MLCDRGHSMRDESSGKIILAGFFSLVFSALAARSSAQAWVAPKGEMSVSLAYQFADFKGHLNQHGNEIPLGGSRSQSVTLDIDSSLTDRFAFTASLPYVATRNGKDPSPAAGHTGIDDGHYHSTWQDYHFNVRYNLLTKPVVLTPFVGMVIPSHHYATIGEAAPGRDLRETHIGFDGAHVRAAVAERVCRPATITSVLRESAGNLDQSHGGGLFARLLSDFANLASGNCQLAADARRIAN